MVARAASGLVTASSPSVFGGTARHRHLGADDIDRRLTARFVPRVLGDCAESCRTLRR